jgi:hypothetical protein
MRSSYDACLEAKRKCSQAHPVCAGCIFGGQQRVYSPYRQPSGPSKATGEAKDQDTQESSSTQPRMTNAQEKDAQTLNRYDEDYKTYLQRLRGNAGEKRSVSEQKESLEKIIKDIDAILLRSNTTGRQIWAEHRKELEDMVEAYDKAHGYDQNQRW